VTHIASQSQRIEGSEARTNLGARGWRVASIIAPLTAASLTLFASQSGYLSAASPAADVELDLLLKFMAAIKAVMALGAIALIAWRLGFAAHARLKLTYCASASAMAAAPALIWFTPTVTAGALLFHTGLILFLATAYFDGSEVYGRLLKPRSLSARRAMPR
jgi:hypothetical protein